MYTDERILKAIKKFYEKYHYMPTQNDFENYDFGVPIDLYLNIFHNWDNVIKSTCDIFYKNHKFCYKCRQVFPLNNIYFSKNKYIDDGFQNWCKTCEEKEKTAKKDKKIVKLTEKNNLDIKKQIEETVMENNSLKNEIKLLKEKAETTKDKVLKENILKEKTKICRRCNQEYPATKEFFNVNTQGYGLHCYCKECRNKERRERYKKEKDALKIKYQKNRLYQIKFTHRKRGFPNITEKDLQQIINNFKNERGIFICPYCEREIENENMIEFDHFIPYSKKQKNLYMSNLIPVCKYCNRSKHDEDFKKWYGQQTFYNILNEQSLIEYVNSKNINQIYREIKAKKNIELYTDSNMEINNNII